MSFWSMKTEKEELNQRIIDYYLSHDTTVRKTAKEFGLSKSQVHKILRLTEYEDKSLFKKILKQIERNKRLRHIRGEMATKKKYVSKKC